MGQVRCNAHARWRADDLDRLTAAELERVDAPVIALDRDGVILAMSPAAAAWAGVAAWQTRGRALVRELGWCFGDRAAAAIAAFVASSSTTSAVQAAPGRRHGATEVDLLRGDGRIYVALAT